MLEVILVKGQQLLLNEEISPLLLSQMLLTTDYQNWAK